jgi:quercetin dioxygenase-like cupin family protein
MMSHRQRSATVLIGNEETGGRFTLVETIEQSGDELPYRRHHWEDKTIYVLDGALALAIAGTWVHAPAGAAVFVPRGAEHAYAITTERARLLTMLTPAGFERFYQEYDAAIGPNATVLPSLEQVVTLAARYGCEITGPHPGRPPPISAAGVVQVAPSTGGAITNREETHDKSDR